MIGGVGTDVCEIARIEAVWQMFGDKFLRRILTDVEHGKGPWTVEKIARRWALKEAVAKACGTGIGGKVGFHDIMIEYSEDGAPRVNVKNMAGHVWASVSDDAGIAVAFAVWEHE